MQFLENSDIKKECCGARRSASCSETTASTNAANVMPMPKTLVHSFRVSHGVRSLTCCWQLTNGRVSLGMPRVPHEVRAGGISYSKMHQQFSGPNED